MRCRIPRILPVLLLVSSAVIASCSSERLQPLEPGADSTRVSLPFHQRYPLWSPRGVIAYFDAGITCVNPDGNGVGGDPKLTGLYIIDPESGIRRKVPQGPIILGIPGCWSSDGIQLLDEYLLRFSDPLSEPDLLPLPYAGSYTTVDWSTDNWLAMETYFSRAADEPRILDGIWIRTVDGTTRRRIFSGGRMPDWHPSGQSIVLVSSPNGTPFDVFSNELFVIDREGTILRRLTNNQAEESNPRFCPNGTKIAFMRRLSPDTLPQIWVMNSDGTGERQLTTRGAVTPSWSPDAREIVYASVNYNANLPGNGVLWIINVETKSERQLTRHWPTWPECSYP